MDKVMMLIIAVWIGMVFGLSFIEAPLKFTAPGITTILGLGIGQIVFSVSNLIQLWLLLVSSMIYFFGYVKINSLGKKVALFLIFIMAMQAIVLLPILDQRATLTISGELIEKSYHHILFIILEILKLISLSILFFKIELSD